jgi:3-oxoadipate enol-lactonase
MAYFKYLDKNVYYDIIGEGKPILILNGIMMSTMSWEPFVKSFSTNNTLIRVDFLDQGQSDKMTEQYTQSIQVDLIKELLDHINIKKVNIVGISYGGEVAISFSIKYQEYVERLMLFNTTANTSNWLSDIGQSWKAVAKTRDGNAYYKTTIPIIYSAGFYQEKIEWMRARELKLNTVFSNPVFLDAMDRLTTSAESYNELKHVSNIKVPTLIVAAEDDSLTPKQDQEKLHQLITTSELIHIPNCGHASMYEKPLLFVTLVLGFINAIETEFKI